MTVVKSSDGGTDAPIPGVGVALQAKEIGEDSKESTSTTSTDKNGYITQIKEHEYSKKIWKFVSWTPKRCRWDPDDPPKFSMSLNLLFGFVSNDSSLCNPQIQYQVYKTQA